MQCIIEKLDHQGRGITRIDGKITFIENALPDEVVDIEIVSSNKNFNEGIIKNIIKKSSKRIEPKCPYYNECGGCNLMHLSYNDQLNYKENKVKEIMDRYANIDTKLVNNIVPSPKDFNYRNKVTLKCNGKLGYYKRRTNDIINIEKCLLLEDDLNEKILSINNKLNTNINEVIIRKISDNVSLTLSLQKEEKEYKKYENLNNILTLQVNKKQINITQESNIFAKLEEFNFIVSPTAFFQVNTLQTINLYNKIKDYIQKFNMPNVLDLYCGTGTIGIYVSDYVDKLIGVEINPKAIEDAKTNAKNNHIKNANFYAGDTKTILHKNNFKADVVIVDPPRAGLDKEVISDLIKINPKEIIYVSCDPVTLARDIKLLKEFYNVLEVTPFDMFPNTYHVENVVALERR